MRFSYNANYVLRPRFRVLGEENLCQTTPETTVPRKCVQKHHVVGCRTAEMLCNLRQVYLNESGPALGKSSAPQFELLALPHTKII